MDQVDLSSPGGNAGGGGGDPPGAMGTASSGVPPLLAAPPPTANVDLSDSVDKSEGALSVDISDALSERAWVKFTVHTRTTLPEFARGEMSVIRLHEEFLWLHDTLSSEDNHEYQGYVIPPAPPRPDFDASREKLRKLGDAEGEHGDAFLFCQPLNIAYFFSGNLTKEEFNKMKQELEAEYLATFKKTVAMHETFLRRLAAHPVFKRDANLRVFLEYDKDLSVRGKNKKEKLAGLLSSFQKTGDELLLSSTQKEVDEFFEREKNFLVEYHAQLKDCTIRSDKMTSLHKSLADTYIKLSQGLTDQARLEAQNARAANGDAAPTAPLEPFLCRVAEALEKMRRIEGRVATDQDLKLSDTLRYHGRDSSAAKDLLYRRLRCLANYEAANKALDRARTRNRDVPQAEQAQSEACQRFESVSARAREELTTLRSRRAVAFQRSLAELAELELKHSRAHAQMLRATIAALKEGEEEGLGEREGGGGEGDADAAAGAGAMQ